MRRIVRRGRQVVRWFLVGTGPLMRRSDRVVLADPDVPDGAAADAYAPAPVGWTTADGSRRAATVPVPVIDRAEDRVIVWLTPAGTVTSPPLDPREAADDAVVGSILAGVGVLLVAWALLGLSRLALNARRSRQWQVDWQAVEPLWTSRER